MIDVGLDSDGDLPRVVRFISGLELVIQRVQRRVRIVQGEYFADVRVGLPYFAWMAQKPAQVASIGAVLRKAIETTPGVTRVDDWAGAFDESTRTLTFSGTIRTPDGEATVSVLPMGEPRAGNVSASRRMVIRFSRISHGP